MYRGDDKYGQQPQQDQYKRRYDEMNYDGGRDNRRNTNHRSGDYDMNQGRQTSERDTTLVLREERGYENKMAEELKIREQQLAMTSNLLEKQSIMLKSLEANMLAQNSRLQRSAPSNNMMPVGNTGQMGISSQLSPMGNMGPMGNKMRNMGNNPSIGNNMGFMGNMNPEFQRSRKPPQDGPPAKRYKNDEFQYESRRRFSKERNRDVIIKQSSMQKKGDVKLCNFCRQPGHFQRNCPKFMSKSGTNVRVEGMSSESLKTCNYCRRIGHIARTCPDKLQNKSPTKKQSKGVFARNDNVLVNRRSDWKSSVVKGSNVHRNGSRSTVSSSSFSSKTRNDSRSAVSSSSVSNKTSPTRNKNFKSTDSKSTSKKDKWSKQNSKTIQHCKVCNGPVCDWSKHIKEPEHKRKSDLLRTGCKICHKFRYNSMNQYRNHHDTSLHKALINVKKQVTESKIKAFSSKIATGVDFVAPVTGYFCKLCKKFYNKEAYAKVQHCQTKAHYDRVAAIIGEKYDTAIGAKYAEIREKVMKEHMVPSDRQMMEAIRKADFVTDIKPLPPAVKTLKKDTKKDDAEKGDNKVADKIEDDVILIASEKDDDVVEIIDDPSRSKLAGVGEKINVTPVIKSGESDLEEYPDDLENMEVLDEADDDNDLVIADGGNEKEVKVCQAKDVVEPVAELEDRIHEESTETKQHIEIENAVIIKDDDNEEIVDTEDILLVDEDGTDKVVLDIDDDTEKVMLDIDDDTDQVVFVKEDGTDKVVLDMEDGTDKVVLDTDDDTDQVVFVKEDGSDKVVLDMDKVVLDTDDGTDKVVLDTDDGTDKVVLDTDDDTDQVVFVKEDDTDQEEAKREKKEVIVTPTRVLRKKVTKAI